MTRTITVEGDLATVDALSRLTTQGSVTAPSLVIPAGVKKIERIYAAGSAEGLADGSGVFFIRLGGPGVLGGEQAIAISAAGRIAVQTGSDAAPMINNAFELQNADIDVSPGDTISVSAEMAGSDLGTGRVVVTLVYA